MRITKKSALLAFGGVALAGTAALAGNGVGGVFNLGQVNTVDATTQLSGAPRAPQLHVINNSRMNGAAGVRATAGRAGVNYGVYATTASPTGYAGYFQNTSTTTDPQRGRGIRSLAANASPALFNPNDGAAGGDFAGPNGVIGVASHPAGAGVVGRTASKDGFAGFFQNSSTTTDPRLGRGIRALAAGASQDVFLSSWHAAGGEFAGPDGVHGVSSRSNGYGVVGDAGEGSIGVFGNAGMDGAFGVYGAAERVFAKYALFAQGNARVAGDLLVEDTLTVQGNLIKPAGTFKIDHPLDPAYKYLSHSFVESPDMMNIYNGNVVTDASGAATVELPGYFEALNRDPRYQLTVIGSFAAAQISREISGNSFSIKTEEPNIKVSWQVTGIRRDAYAEAHPIVVEEEKKLAERGRYLHPEEHGQPAELAIHSAQGLPRQAGLAVPAR